MTLKHPLTASERETLAACMSARGQGHTAALNATFGRFAYRNVAGGQIELIGTDWTRRNIAEINVPEELPGWPVNSITGRPQQKMYVHRLMAPPLRLAWREIRARGLHTKLRTYDGCWVPRHQLHNPRNPLSVHSWAGAIDLDARWNGYGARPTINMDVIEVLERFGFSSGARWTPWDAMHIEWVLPAPRVPRMPWQDSALSAAASIPVTPPKPAPIVVTAKPEGPPYRRPEKVFLRSPGGHGNEVMVGKEARYGGGTVTRLDDGSLRLEGFSGTVGVYPDHAIQLDRLEETK